MVRYVLRLVVIVFNFCVMAENKKVNLPSWLQIVLQAVAALVGALLGS